MVKRKTYFLAKKDLGESFSSFNFILSTKKIKSINFVAIVGIFQINSHK